MYLVEPMGFEPTTFPVLPGRALDGRRQTDQLLYEFPAFLALYITFPPYRLLPGIVRLLVNECPRSAISQCYGIIGVVIFEPILQILRLSDVIPACRFTSQDV